MYVKQRKEEEREARRKQKEEEERSASESEESGSEDERTRDSRGKAKGRIIALKDLRANQCSRPFLCAPNLIRRSTRTTSLAATGLARTATSNRRRCLRPSTRPLPPKRFKPLRVTRPISNEWPCPSVRRNRILSHRLRYPPAMPILMHASPYPAGKETPPFTWAHTDRRRAFCAAAAITCRTARFLRYQRGAGSGTCLGPIFRHERSSSSRSFTASWQSSDNYCGSRVCCG